MNDDVFQYLKILKSEEIKAKKKILSQKKIESRVSNGTEYQGKHIRKLYCPNYLILLG